MKANSIPNLVTFMPLPMVYLDLQQVLVAVTTVISLIEYTWVWSHKALRTRSEAHE